MTRSQDRIEPKAATERDIDHGMDALKLVPGYRSYFNPVLQALRALGGSASIEELNARVTSDMNLSSDMLAVPHDPEHGGQSEVAYRIAWASRQPA